MSNLNNANITIQTKEQNVWSDGMVKTTASQVTEEANRKFVNGIEKIKIQSIPANIDGIPLSGQDNLTRLYISGDPSGNGVKTISRVTPGAGSLPVIVNGTDIFVFLTNGHSRSSLLINIEGSTSYPVKYFGNTNIPIIGQIQSNTLLQLHFYDQAWHITGALDYTPLIDTKVASNTPIAGGTGAKINYDSKGLVIGSGMLSDTDIPLIPIDKVVGLSQIIATLTDPATIDEIRNNVNTKITENSAIVPGTSTKVSYDSKGLVTSGTNLTEFDIPTLSISKTQDLQVTLDSKLNKNDIITPGIGTKVTYDAKGLITDSDILDANDIPLLNIDKVINLQETLDSKVIANTPITASTATKITYDDNGLITSGDNLDASDIPDIPIAKVTGLSEALSNAGTSGSITNLQNQLLTKVDGNSTIAGGTATKVTYDNKGLVTSGTNLILSDIPDVPITKVTGLQSALDNKASTNDLVISNDTLNSKINTKVSANNNIVSGTATKISYDAKGLVTGGSSLIATDIPNLDIPQITGLQPALDLKISSNTSIAGGTATKVTYDTKGLVVNGTDLSPSDIPALSISKITNLQTTLDSKVISNAPVTATTATKISYDAKGLVTGGTTLIESDLPALSINKVTNLQTTLDAKLNKNVYIAAGTATKITYDTKGLVTGSGNLIDSDIPNISISKVTGLTDALLSAGSVEAIDNLQIDIDSKVISNPPITAGTATKVTYDDKGLVTSGTDLVSSDIPALAISKITNLQSSLDSKVVTNTAIIAGTATKVTYDEKGLVTGGTNIIEDDVPLLAIAKTRDLQESLDSKINKNIPITANSATKVTYDIYGLITGGSNLTKNDIPNIDISQVNGLTVYIDEKADRQYVDNLIINSQEISATKEDLNVVKSDLNTLIETKVDKNNNITAGTSTKVTYDDKGLVTAGTNLIEADIPALSIAKVTNLQTTLDTKLNKNVAISQGTATKITYDTKGLVTSSSSLTENDIPTLSIPKINNLQNQLDDRVTVTNFGSMTDDLSRRIDRKLDTPVPHAPGVGMTKVWYNAYGVITSGSPLAVEDLPTPIPVNYINNLDNILDNVVLNDTSFEYDAGDTTVVLNNSNINLLSLVNSSKKINMPLASSSKPGIMPKESFAQIVQNTSDISAMKGANRRWAIHDAVLPDDTIAAGQTALTTAYTIATSDPTPNDADTLLYINAGNIAFTWFTSTNRWVNRGADTASKATNTSLGLVKGINNNGKIFIENDGTMSLVGYDTLTTADTNLLNTVNTKVAANGAITGGTATKITYDAKGLVTGGTTLVASDIPNLTISQITNLQTSLNGKAPTSHAAADATYGIASSVNYGHAMAGSSVPLAPSASGTLGTDNGKFARDDHAHPIQTVISGNAGTATKLATARNIALTNDVTGNANFDGSGNISISVDVVDNSHLHTISNITSLQTTLDTKALATDVTNSVNTINTSLGTKVDKNTAITAGTSTKITYDAKGLITGGTTLVAADIPNMDWSKITTGKPNTLAGYGINDAVNSSDIVTVATANKILKLDATGLLPTSITGNAPTASKLQTGRSIALSGDASGSIVFDGSGNVTIPTTLANTGVTIGTYGKVTVDSKGRVTAGTTLLAADIPTLAISKITGLQTELDNKVDENAAITAGTATKVSYDSKGLITGGTTLVAADIPSMDWSKITTGKPNTLAGYGISDAIPSSASCNKNWYWAGQSGQPPWLWGSADGSNMYVYNPSNFNVNHATSADYATTAISTDNSTKIATTEFVKTTLNSANDHTLDVFLHNSIYKGSTSGTDTNNINTILTFRRQDDTIIIKNTLSNPNINGQYTTDTWQLFDIDGITIIRTIIWTYDYNATITLASAVPNSWSYVEV